MKKKVMIYVIIVTMLVLSGYFWWNMPVYFAKGIDAAEVRQMQILDKNAERAVVLIPCEEMNYILDNLSDIQFKKSGISVGNMDYGLEITIIGNNGKVVSKFDVNSDHMIGKEPFLYKAQSASICYEYLESLNN